MSGFLNIPSSFQAFGGALFCYSGIKWRAVGGGRDGSDVLTFLLCVGGVAAWQMARGGMLVPTSLLLVVGVVFGSDIGVFLLNTSAGVRRRGALCHYWF